MRYVDLKTPRPAAGQEALVARLVRHLEARLKDFGPGGPEVLQADQESGLVAARFPGSPRTPGLRTWIMCGAVCLSSYDLRRGGNLWSPPSVPIGNNEKERGTFRSPFKQSISPNPLVGWVNRQTQRRRMTCGAFLLALL